MTVNPTMPLSTIPQPTSADDEAAWEHIRQAFPGLARQDIYLDSAASAQQPQCVINAVHHYHSHQHANVHRGAYARAEQATAEYERARETVQTFIHAASKNEIIWTSGATESINIVAQCFAASALKAGDEIMISMLEHHANFVPWQQLAQTHALKLQVINVTATGELDLADFHQKLSTRTKLVAITCQSNAIGTPVDVQSIIQSAKAKGAVTLVDASQAIVHQAMDVQALDCDFLVFSGHKLFGPTGIGVLYGKYDLLNNMRPYQFGGEMITHVSLNETHFQAPPLRFEAGTPNISGAIGLAKAITWLNAIPLSIRNAREKYLTQYLLASLEKMPFVQIIGPRATLHAIVSIVFTDESVSDIATLLDEMGICVRTGHHCAMPLMQHLSLDEGTLRISLSFYNTPSDIDQCCNAIQKAYSLLNE